ncbi:F-box/LRR-repeat protein 14 [Armadillidium nasatum]|uniref:F-box/LRR-repeat protein 14 n=1 Tax=Armadillidium nasatum TaxID=96803 RepID=A0A5N5SVV4_9CRUS|nr:F-box/LRR-repeat protein 14 [Armadillidium nasatum]
MEDSVDQRFLPRYKTTHVSCLYPEILALIFRYLDVKDKGRVARVCSAWRDAAYHKSVWRGVEAKLHLRSSNPYLFQSLVRRGIRRVQVLSLDPHPTQKHIRETGRHLRDVIIGVPGLASLNLSGCYNVTDESLKHAFVQECHSLTHLNLSLCKQITDNSLGDIAKCLSNLEVLELGGCSYITNMGLFLVAWGFKRLKHLDLRSCSLISNQGIACLAGQSSKQQQKDGTPYLEYLGLQDCQKLSDEALRYVGLGLPSLKSINLSFCASITDSGLKYLARMPGLKEINLRSCDNISDIGIAYLAEGGSRITHLDVSFCDKIGDQALIHISQGLFTLRSLSCSACQISDDGIYKIARTLHELDTLNIGQCERVTDRGLQIISEHLTNLSCIDLYGCNRITTVGLERIMKLPRLAVLNLGLWHKHKR